MPQNVPHLLYFDSIGLPEEGYISTTQQAEKIPFQVKRVFWTYNTPAGVVRGRHAHKQTEQVLVALNGTIRVEVESGAGEAAVFVLDAPDKGLYLPPLHWTRIHISEGAVLLSLASTDYVEEDYIRDYDVFLQEVRQ
ncbi:sugar 3,4-ketoisomerase [Botryobacter ruber]|uniref:sugar 3,4-ketoisomerase n=1 Tax=Botryobacter ruber TaxID=2171629 RepID=UPI000E0AB027|nr:FdtA/QdtA family cupin domain-containing protein [Botryobacter ruber]